MATLSKPYRTIDEAALGGFKKIITSFPDYKYNEYAFLVVSFPEPVVRQIGHEGFMDTDDVLIIQTRTRNILKAK